jgi:hypothetical protein
VAGHATKGRITSFRDVVDLWPTRVQLARDLNLSYQTVVSWHVRDAIAPRHWHAIVAAAETRGIPLSYTRLRTIHNKRLGVSGVSAPSGRRPAPYSCDSAAIQPCIARHATPHHESPEDHDA